MKGVKTKIPANVLLAGIFISKNYVSMKKHDTKVNKYLPWPVIQC